MRIKNCIICGNKFESRYGKEVCSDDCFLERKKIAEKKSNERRYAGISGTPEIKTCPICNKKFEALNRKYCSEKCSDLARAIKRKELFSEWYADEKNRKFHIENVKKYNKQKNCQMMC